MPTIREWLSRFWSTLRPGRRDADLEAELRAHLDLAAEDEARRINSTAGARRAATIKYGALTQSVAVLRDQRGLPWLDDLAADLRYALRTLRRSPMFTSVAVLTLALGIGANTAIFSLADAVLLRSLPVANPDELVMLRQRGPTGDIMPFTTAAATDLAASRDVLSGLAAFRPVPDTHVAVGGETELALTQSVSRNYHAVLGIRPVLGRLLNEQDRDIVAVISHRYWRRRFGSDPNVVGRALEMRGRAVTIVGVTPPAFFGTQPGQYVDVTVPLLAGQTTAMRPNARWLYLIGRRATGVSREQAQSALRTRWAQITAGTGSQSRSVVTLEVDPGAQGLNGLRRQFSLPLRILMVAVGVVLLLACANIAGLLVVRSRVREREIAVRAALGAARARIVRQLVTESLLLAVVGGAAAVGLASLLTSVLLAMMSRGRAPIVLDVSPNLRTLAFTAVVTIVTALLFGLLPALGASRMEVPRQLKRSNAGPDGRSRWRHILAAAQVALLVLLLSFAGLFARTLHKLHAVDAGFHQDQVFLARISPGPVYGPGAARGLYDALAARLGALPAIRSVSMSMDSPLGGELSMGAGINIPGRPPEDADGPQVYHNLVGPRFFETMGIPLLAGRDFDVRDDERAPKCTVITESVARRYFPGEDPIGRQIVLGSAPATVVGIVKDVRYTSLRDDAPLMIYRPARQETGAMAVADRLLIRAASVDAATLTAMIRSEVRAIAPMLPPPSVVSLEDQMAATLVEERLLAALSSAIGVLAALLAAVGIYSTVATAVTRRRREIGIRMALGARPGQVLRTVMTEATAIVGIGLGIGVPVALAAFWAARGILEGVLFELSPTDPTVLLSSAGAIVVIAGLAAYMPAWAASRIDPVAAIKRD